MLDIVLYTLFLDKGGLKVYPMGWLLFALFVAVPIIEIVGFIQIGSLIGIWPTIGIVILTAIAGSILLRHQGMAALFQAQSKLAQGGIPFDQVIDGICLGFAGALLLTPGFFTDFFGFLLFIPPFRRSLAWFFYDKVIKPRTHIYTADGSHTSYPGENQEGQVIDGEFQDISDDAKKNRSDKQTHTPIDKGKKGGKSPWQD